jgi:glycosyltransferase involved in cell wall biosynthesis
MTMSSASRVIAVIPAFNEAKTIAAVVAGVQAYVADVIVVDDHSADTTGDEAKRAGAIVLRNAANLGYDGSLNAGFAEAARRGAGIVLTFDADGEHDPADVPRLIAPIAEDRADIVAGQRPRLAGFAETIFAVYTRLRYGIADPLCGLKAYRRSVYDAVGQFDTVQSIGTELMIRGLHRKFRLALVPIALHRRTDISRFYARRLRANLKTLRAAWRLLLVQ